MVSTQPHDDLLRPLTAEETARAHSWMQVWFQRFVDAILQPITFLAAVIWLLGGAYGDIAIVAIATGISYALGGVVMPFALAKVENIRLLLLGANGVRAIASLLMIVIGWRSQSISSPTLVLLLVIALLMYQLSSVVNVSRNPRSFVANQDQPTSARSRQVVGALAGIAGAIIAWRTLGNAQLEFKQAFGILIVLAGLASLGSIWFQVTAPLRYQDIHAKLPVPTWSEFQQVIRNSEIRRYLLIRLVIGLATLADAFLIVFGLYKLGLGSGYIGAAMAAVVLAQVIGGSLWTFLGDMPGSRRSIQLATALRLGALTLAVAVPYLGSSTWYRSIHESDRLASWLFVTVFFLLGLSQTTLTRNEHHYAMRRLDQGTLYPALDLLLNSLLVVTAFTPVLGVMLINAFGLSTTMAIATIISFIAFLGTAFLVARRTLPRIQPTRTPRKSVRPVSRETPPKRGIKIKRVK